MTCPGPFSSVSRPGPLGHHVTMRAQGVQVEVDASTRDEAESDAFLALTRELARLSLYARCRSVFRSSKARRSS